ncbi:MAG TPA: gamma-glutamyl-gamma-aminobutyrate hydrolase family protein [Streptomyces sp.]|uniref:gamma-glutamyl-gamma-aminobutyrate hydrolase family protein n=1 Tax=Streptomyces sp. TaxID=1931 RepID=UPI002D5344F6|nr:gamma-glutamyl-gamma-aminobutyrate hydrolase family protein [Streptomyces sp.]HZG04585.1 gamma-glutamyl-gamma-aminobutyrate hydrolase family protein [Streptomyces sp.]
MTYIAVSQRVATDPAHGTRSDAADQRWWAFLRGCGLLPLPLPNDPVTVRRTLADLPVGGILLTGGNDLAVCGGRVPERDATESVLIDEALSRPIPLIGVCRGMQHLQHRFGARLWRVTGQVAERQVLEIDGRRRTVNSYHHWATTETPAPLLPWVRGPGRIVKAVRHESAPLLGIMWHPERIEPFAEEDRALFRSHFGGTR